MSELWRGSRAPSLWPLTARVTMGRLATTDGTPPEHVTTREDELLECLDGIRPLTAFNYCLPGELEALIDDLSNPESVVERPTIPIDTEPIVIEIE